MIVSNQVRFETNRDGSIRLRAIHQRVSDVCEIHCGATQPYFNCKSLLWSESASDFFAIDSPFPVSKTVFEGPRFIGDQDLSDLQVVWLIG